MSYFRLDYYHKKYLITSNYYCYLVWSWGKTSSFAARAWWEVVAGKQADRWDMCCYSLNVAWNFPPLFWLSFVSSFATLEVMQHIISITNLTTLKWKMRSAKSSITNLCLRSVENEVVQCTFLLWWMTKRPNISSVLTGIRVFIPDILNPGEKAKALWTKEYFCYSWRGISWWWDSVASW